MAIDLIVVRNPGDRQGPDIVEGLLSETSIAILRGTTEIDDNEPILSVSLAANYRTGLRKGDIVQVLDELQGSEWRGKVVGVSHTVQGADMWTDLDIEKPTRLYQ